MEYLIGILVALFGGVIYFKKKAQDASVDAKLAETKGKDSILITEAAEIQKAIEEIDKNIARMKAARETSKKENTDNLTLIEIKKRIKNGQNIK